jgi:hypothetical protein
VQAQILATYPDPLVMSQLMVEANQAYLLAREEAGQVRGEGDTVSAIVNDSEKPSPALDLAASQLFVSPEDLASAPGIQVEDGFGYTDYGGVSAGSRSFREAYADLLCELQNAGLNKPVGCR